MTDIWGSGSEGASQETQDEAVGTIPTGTGSPTSSTALAVSNCWDPQSPSPSYAVANVPPTAGSASSTRRVNVPAAAEIRRIWM